MYHPQLAPHWFQAPTVNAAIRGIQLYPGYLHFTLLQPVDHLTSPYLCPSMVPRSTTLSLTPSVDVRSGYQSNTSVLGKNMCTFNPMLKDSPSDSYNMHSMGNQSHHHSKESLAESTVSTDSGIGVSGTCTPSSSPIPSPKRPTSNPVPGKTSSSPGRRLNYKHNTSAPYQKMGKQTKSCRPKSPTETAGLKYGKKMRLLSSPVCRRQLVLDDSSKDPYTQPENQGKRRKQHRSGQIQHPKSASSPSVSSSFTMPDMLKNNEMDKVTQAIWRHFMQNKQTEETYALKMRLRNVLYNILKDIFPMCYLYVVGSSMNGMGSDDSDMDVCLVLFENEQLDQRTQSTEILRYIMRLFQKFPFIHKTQLISAKVPILKFADRISGVEVDLNVNSTVGIRNTQLLKCYSRVDERVSPLVLAIKRWAREQDINDAQHMTLSSYSLELMVIHYLQCGCDPPVLPSLQKLMPNKFSPHADVRQLVLLEDVPFFDGKNYDSLGELLLGFLDYYSNKFDYEKNAISIRLGCTLPKHVVIAHKSPKNNKGQWKYICIEEPFDRTNTSRSVYDETAFNRILMEFRTSWSQLEETKDLLSIMEL